MRGSNFRVRDDVSRMGHAEFSDEPLSAGSIDVLIIIAGIAIGILVAIWWVAS
jgi:hypothetical protein